MSTTQRQAMMDSSLGLDRLELNPSSAAVGVTLTPRLSAGLPAPVGPQGQAHLNGCVPLSHQVAGHKYGVDKVGILQHPDGTVLKQLQPPPRGPREMQFYCMVYAEDCCDPCLLELKNHLPKYYGTWSSPDCPSDLYLKLEDVTQRFIKPCIMDVKLGQQSYDPFASQEKREQQIRKYPLMEEMGFLVLGMRVYKVCSDTFHSYDQHYGRGLDKDTIKEGLNNFFHNGFSLRKDAVSASICRVQRILRWFESQQQLNFYASSLLFVYEGLTSSLSSSSLSLHFSNPSICATAVKTSSLSSVGGNDWDGKGETKLEEMGQGEEVAEYNNNIQLSVPWDYSLATIYTNYTKSGHHHCAKSQLHGNSGDGDAVETVVSSFPEVNISALCEEDNSTWKRIGRSQQLPNRNGNKSQLERKDEDAERKDSSSSRRREEDKEKLIGRRGDATEGSGGDVEVRMIDFAHVFPSQSRDHGYIYGLKHLLMVLEQILNETV